MEEIKSEIWGKTSSGEEIQLFTLTNSHGVKVQLSELGAGIVSIYAPDRNGHLDDIVLGYDNVGDYEGDGPCMGKTPGRYANRIAGGSLNIDGQHYQLDLNTAADRNHLHGGNPGFANRKWTGKVEEGSVVFTYVSPDGESGYPGEVTATVRYTLSDHNTLQVDLQATTNRPTVVNLTNHTYFNLKGEGNGDILDHELRLYENSFLVTDEDLIPSGEMRSVEGTPMDFREEKLIGKEIRTDYEPLRFGKGYDHCWVLERDEEDKEVSMAAVLSHEGTGRVVGIATNQPGVQIYTGNWLEGCPQGKKGHIYHDNDGVAIECQALPDSPNHANFPNTILREGEKYDKSIIFYFLTF
ncbi:MAG: galactose mutarotase [Bacteroidales bacterium]|nr:galactose mutarotase [Bacteroidales bacterium]